MGAVWSSASFTKPGAESGAILWRRALAMNSRVGQPFACCQRRCGRKIARARSPPAQKRRDRKTSHRRARTRPDDEAEAEVEDADLVEEPHARDRPEGEPEPLAAAGEHAHEEPRDERPEEEVEGVHRVGAAEGQGHRREAGGESGEGLGERAAAEGRGDPAGEPDGRGHRERRHHAQREVRLARHLRHEPGDPAHERRVIDVAPARPPAAGHVVELVPEDTVAGEEGQVEEEDARGRRPLGQALRARPPRSMVASFAATAIGAVRFPSAPPRHRPGELAGEPERHLLDARVAERPRAAVARPVGGAGRGSPRG